MSTYKLRITCTAASKPWTHDYVPVVPRTDENARTWASAMQKTLGSEYVCTLLRDGVPVDGAGRAPVNADLFGGVS